MAPRQAESPTSWLDSLQARGVRLGLDAVRRLCAALADPQDALESVLVAGTNGKGTTAAVLAAGLTAAGRSTGLFLSPHLVHVRERFRIDGSIVDPAALDRALRRVRRAAREAEAAPTYFEATTAAAFQLFRESGCHTMVLEVGLGGRLDATNVVARPRLSVVTPIGLDHTRELGGTLAAIAREKAGIFRRGSPALLAPQPAEAEAALLQAAQEVGARPVLRAGEDGEIFHGGAAGLRLRTASHDLAGLRPRLRGRAMAQNLLTALRGLEILETRLDVATLRRVLEETSLPGRLDRRPGDPEILLDGAHNPDAARALAEWLLEEGLQPVLLFGCMADKDRAGILEPLIPVAESLVLTRVDHPRASDPDELRRLAERLEPGRSVRVQVPVREALELARDLARREGRPLLVAGSLYLVGETLSLLEGASSLASEDGSY